MEESTPQRGTKRKRHEDSPQAMSARISGKLHHDLKEVKKAAKKAKAFETQKLVKKLKNIRKKSEASEEITEAERQLKFLKQLDHEVVATTALKTKLNKHRILIENEDVQAAISKELVTNIIPATPGSGTAKVQSRLLSSKILASEIATVVNSLKYIIEPPNTSVELSSEDETASHRPQKLKKGDKVKKTTSVNSATTYHTPLEDVQGEQGLEKDLDVDDAGWDSGTVDEEEIEEKIGWESDSASENGGNESSHKSDDGDELAIPSPPQKAPSKSRSTQASRQLTGMHSTFLPSLSVGFTRGDSDTSDLSESEVKVADIDIKKNRRGQRARRAIWEKKFGKNANHKKKEAQATGLDRNRSTRWTIDNKVPYHPHQVDAGWSQHVVAASNSVPQKSTVPRNLMKRRVEEKPIHPSWEAKRKLKEKESVGILPSQGTKIKF